MLYLCIRKIKQADQLIVIQLVVYNISLVSSFLFILAKSYQLVQLKHKALSRERRGFAFLQGQGTPRAEKNQVPQPRRKMQTPLNLASVASASFLAQHQPSSAPLCLPKDIKMSLKSQRRLHFTTVVCHEVVRKIKTGLNHHLSLTLYFPHNLMFLQYVKWGRRILRRFNGTCSTSERQKTKV